MFRMICYGLLLCCLVACGVEKQTPPPTTTQATEEFAAEPTIASTTQNNVQNVVSQCEVRTDWFDYTVITGDTLADLGRRTNSTTQQLINGNCLTDASLIRTGQILKVPTAPAPREVEIQTAQAMQILNFEMSPNNPQPGDLVQLRWQVVGAKSVTLRAGYAYPTVLVEAQGLTSGTVDYTLSPSLVYTWVFTLTAVDVAGQNVYDSIVLNWECTDTLFFGKDAQTDSTCPGGSVYTIPVSYQPFENGFVIYAESFIEHLNYPLLFIFSDVGKRETRLKDPAEACLDLATYLPPPPPEGFKLPDARILSQWAFDPSMQAQLGWALQDATRYPAQIQFNARREDAQKGFGAWLYISLPDDRVVALEIGWSVEWHRVD